MNKKNILLVEKEVLSAGGCHADICDGFPVKSPGIDKLPQNYEVIKRKEEKIKSAFKNKIVR
ncbi:MAG: hypothetical protein KAW12_09800 [Candidatus Aminicenantes bacterium]|nr:hypothetical protein [Candidatus Aminicenantes bacterium]